MVIPSLVVELESMLRFAYRLWPWVLIRSTVLSRMDERGQDPGSAMIDDGRKRDDEPRPSNESDTVQNSSNLWTMEHDRPRNSTF